MTEQQRFEDYREDGRDQDFEDEAFGWDDEIEKDSEFILLKPGDHPFVVVDFERARYGGGEKMGPCPQAIIHMQFTSPEGEKLTLKHNLYLHKKCEGLISQFFVGIGLKKHGERLKMDWGAVIGRTGHAKIGIRKYNDNEYNDIKRILEPKAAEPQKTAYTEGTF